MKKHLLTLLAATAVCLQAQALINAGEGRIDLKVAATSEFDSRITARSSGGEDLVTNASTTLAYSRPSRVLNIEAEAGVTVYRYADFSEYDDENLLFGLSLSPGTGMRTSRFTLSGDVMLRNETKSNEDVGAIVTSRNYGGSLRLAYDPNRHYNVVATATANREDPQGAGYSRIDRAGGGLAVEVPFGEERNWTVGVSYEDTRSDTGFAPANNTFTYYAGVGGKLLPKLSGDLSVGMQQRDFDDGGSDSAPYLLAGLTWTLDESTTAQLQASKRYSASINELATDSLETALTIQRVLNPRWTASAGAGYTDTSYDALASQARDDEEYFVNGALYYQLARWGSVGATARYSDRSSSDPAFSYGRTRVGLTFSGRW